MNSKAFSPIQTFINTNRCNKHLHKPPGESHVSHISKECYVNYFNSSHRQPGTPVMNQVAEFSWVLESVMYATTVSAIKGCVSSKKFVN